MVLSVSPLKNIAGKAEAKWISQRIAEHFVGQIFVQMELAVGPVKPYGLLLVPAGLVCVVAGDQPMT